jgi:hypothetical protein
MCGKKSAPAAPAKDPAWKTASAANTANRGVETPLDQNRRIGATADAGATLGSSASAAGAAPTTSVLGG